MNTTTVGDSFEARVYSIFEKLLTNDKLYVDGKKSKIFRKKGYFSKDRESEIIFDISIETYLPGATQYSLLTLIECKYYTSPVSVNEIEEFSSKIEQVGRHNTKGVFITNSSYQKGALTLGRSRQLGMARIKDNNEIEWVLYREDNPDQRRLLTMDSNDSEKPFLAELEQELLSTLPDLLLKLGVIDDWQPYDDFLNVPYLTSKDIDYKIRQLNLERCYRDNYLNMDSLCEVISVLYDVQIDLNADLTSGNDQSPLGEITFNPLKISISKNISNENRHRFTIAHEIAHLVLHLTLLRFLFNKRMDTEDTIDLSTQFSSKTTFSLEFQANMFASQLLMPTYPLARYMASYFKRKDIRTGFVYADEQPINQANLIELLMDLSQRFGVSQEVAKLRLKKCDLLRDANDKSIRVAFREAGYI